MPASKVTSKGQITVPKAVREALNVKPGDRINFSIHADGTVTVEADAVDLRSLRGVLKSRRGHRSLAELDDAIRRGATRR